ncbi:type IV pilus assembly protein PilM [bacterium]|nr:MAG: type IV pilus assembly protein PilM [bacterium]
MARKLTSVLGIDIGSSKIKVCEIKTQGREPVVTALGIADTPEGAVDHTGIFNPDAVGEALKKAIADAGASTGFAVVTLAGQASVLVRTLEVPKMNPAELKDHMQWEINRNIPFAESTIVSDFKPLGGEDPNSPNMDVVMAIAPQSAVDTIIQATKKAGKTTEAIDVEPLSLARTMRQNYDEGTDKTVCLVEIGHKTTSINIYHGAKLLMPRQVPMGGELFTRAIADAMGIGLDEAEATKRDSLVITEAVADRLAAPVAFDGGFGAADYGTPNATQEFNQFNPFADDVPAYTPDATGADPMGYAPVAPLDADPLEFAPVAPMDSDPADVVPASVAAEPVYDPIPAPVTDDPVVTAILPVLEEFLSEVRRSIDYFRSRGGDVQEVYLTGGGAKLKGLDMFLSRSLAVPCDAYDPLKRLNTNVRKVAPTFLDEHRNEFAIAIGNGLHIFFD